MSEQIDRLGTVASCLCAIHCAACALLPAALSTLGLGLLFSPVAEWVFTLVAIAFAVGTLIINWKQTRSRLVIIFFTFGIIGLLASRMIEESTGHHDHLGAHPHPVETSQVLEKAKMADSNKDHQTVESHAHVHTDHHEEAAVSATDEHTNHTTGLIVGILAGLFLVIGHILNIRTLRQSQIDCC